MPMTPAELEAYLSSLRTRVDPLYRLGVAPVVAVPTDTTAPVLQSATIPSNGLSIALVYDEVLNAASVPAAGAFSLAGTGVTVSSVGIAGSTVTLTLSGAVAFGASVTLNYTPGGAPIRDAAGNNSAALVSRAVVNNVPNPGDVTAPVLSTVAIPSNGLSVVLTYNETLNTSSVPAAGAFSLAGTSATVSSVSVFGSAVTLNLSTAVLQGATVTLNYTPGGAPIEDAAGNDAASLSARAVTNNSTVTADVTAPTLSSAVIPTGGTSLVLTYSEALSTGSVPAAGAFSLAGTAITVSSVGIAGSAVTLTLSGGVLQGATVTVSYTPGGAPIRDVAGNNAASLTGQAVTNNSTVTGLLTPDQIFTGGTLAAWYRGDDVVTSSGKVTQRNDRSGNGRHEVPIGSSPNPARAPTAVASDSRINNQPSVLYNGEAESSANRDATGVTWTRAAPGTTARWICRVFCQEGPNLGTNRYPFSDASGGFAIRRSSGAGSSVAALTMLNTAGTNVVTTPVDTVYKRHVSYFSNSLLTDYQQWGTEFVSGQNAGNVAGTIRKTATAPTADLSWAWISVAEEIEVELPAGTAPTLTQLSQVDAYLEARYGSGIF